MYLSDNFQFTVLEEGDSLTGADARDVMGRNQARQDTFIKIGTTLHRHRGGTTVPPDFDQPDLTLASGGGGTLPGGNSIYYRYTFVDADGVETGGSAENHVTPAASLDPPAAPTLVDTPDTGGVLEPGDYYYVLSYYQGTTLKETRALNVLKVTVPPGTSTNQIELDLGGSLPGGVTGVNIYRRRAGHAHFYYLASRTDVVTTFVDDGTVDDDCERGLPAANTTNDSYDVTVDIPGTPPVDAVAVRIYRSFDDTNWNRSFLTELTLPTVTYQDFGDDTTVGYPPEITGVQNPEKVVLTDGLEVQGVLPASMVGIDVVAVSFEESDSGEDSPTIGESEIAAGASALYVTGTYPMWEALTAYALDQIVTTLDADPGILEGWPKFVAVVAGTTGAAAPTWDVSAVGAITVDGTVEWEFQGWEWPRCFLPGISIGSTPPAFGTRVMVYAAEDAALFAPFGTIAVYTNLSLGQRVHVSPYQGTEFIFVEAAQSPSGEDAWVPLTAFLWGATVPAGSSGAVGDVLTLAADPFAGGGPPVYGWQRPGRLTINAQTGTTYAPVLADEGKLVTLTNAAAITVTLPADATLDFPIGATIEFTQLGAGQVTFAAGGGATVNGTPGLKTRAQYSVVRAIKTAANTWLLADDLAA